MRAWSTNERIRRSPAMAAVALVSCAVAVGLAGTALASSERPANPRTGAVISLRSVASIQMFSATDGVGAAIVPPNGARNSQ